MISVLIARSDHCDPYFSFLFCLFNVFLFRPDTVVAAAVNDAVDKAVAVKAAADKAVADKAGAHKAAAGEKAGADPVNALTDWSGHLHEPSGTTIRTRTI